jgi:hypothetical protein
MWFAFSFAVVVVVTKAGIEVNIFLATQKKNNSNQKKNQ